MKLIHEFSSYLLHLLLLAELFVRSSSRPTPSTPLCGTFRSMIHHVDKLMNLSRKLHDLTEDEVKHFGDVHHRLDSLPEIHHTSADIRLLQVNESLSQLYAHTQSFKLHIDWLKTARENVSASSQSIEGASSHLQGLSDFLKASLQHMGEEAPQSTPPSLPVVSSAFDALIFSMEMSNRLQVFCDWSKRVLHHIKKQSCSQKH
ncbi:interleukin-11-like [Salarias fasciatus]|uniref:interleukin-11-like n=1 Tax=Salarias fasciatus TaxID=181472 RepID=UPI001176C093|nr:interleukin-11-like [Salarias fasciatus]